MVYNQMCVKSLFQLLRSHLLNLMDSRGPAKVGAAAVNLAKSLPIQELIACKQLLSNIVFT